MFALYLTVVAGLGVFGAIRSNTVSDYLLADRSLSAPVAALSEQATLWSGWITVGFPGTIYSGGLSAAWWLFWCIPGSLFSWAVLAKRFSRYTRILKALTIPEFLGARFSRRSTSIKLLSIATIIWFYFFYVAVQVLAGADTMNGGLGFDWSLAFGLTILFVVFYTIIGGFFAVSLSDVLQGILMLIFASVVPVFVLVDLGGFSQFVTQFNEVGTAAQTSWTGGLSGIALVVTIVGVIGFGFPFAGMPHGVTRYMSMKRPSKIGFAMLTAALFMGIALVGIPFIAIGGMIMFPDVEQDLISSIMISELLPGWLAGLLLAGIVAAVMSSADSMLLLAGSAVGEDVYKNFVNPDASNERVIFVTRLAVLVVGAAAAAIAWVTPATVHTLTEYAWGGLGVTFASVFLLSVYWEGMTGEGTLAGLVTGLVSTTTWHYSLSGGPIGIFDIYLVFPCLLITVGVIILVSWVTGPPGDPESVKEELKAITTPLADEVEIVRRERDEGPTPTTTNADPIAVTEIEAVEGFVQQFDLDELPTANQEAVE